MTQEYQIRVQPHVAANEQALRSWLADEYGFDVRTVTALRILRRSIDARQRTIFVNLKVRVYINEPPQDDAYVATYYPDVSDRPQVYIYTWPGYISPFRSYQSSVSSLNPGVKTILGASILPYITANLRSSASKLFGLVSELSNNSATL